jgi:hypothetical protein
MPTPALVPVHVDAITVEGGQPRQVAGEDSAKPFDDSAQLEPGVHLHWALPDGLTRGAHAKPGDDFLTFPAVPDLWLVVRWHPPSEPRKAAEWRPPGSVLSPALQFEATFRRGYRAWVVDALTREAVPLESWSPPDPAAKRPRLTAVGELEGGRLEAKSGPAEVQNRLFDAAYYPTARNRFGFHDALAGMGPGPYSYAVVGWYSRLAEDPLHAAGSDKARRAFAEARRWDVPWKCAAPVKQVVNVLAEASNDRIPLRSFQLEELPAAPGPVRQAPRHDVLRDLQRQLMNGLGGEVRARPGVLVPFPTYECHPDRIYCHGAVVDVAWAGGGGGVRGKPEPAPVPELLVSSSLYAAAAEGFANGGLEELVQALELDLGGEMGTNAARQAFAHRLHASEFASHAGGQDAEWFVEPTGGESGTVLSQQRGFGKAPPVPLGSIPPQVKTCTVRDLALRRHLAKQLGGGTPAARARRGAPHGVHARRGADAARRAGAAGAGDRVQGVRAAAALPQAGGPGGAPQRLRARVALRPGRAVRPRALRRRREPRVPPVPRRLGAAHRAVGGARRRGRGARDQRRRPGGRRPVARAAAADGGRARARVDAARPVERGADGAAVAAPGGARRAGAARPARRGRRGVRRRDGGVVGAGRRRGRRRARGGDPRQQPLRGRAAEPGRGHAVAGAVGAAVRRVPVGVPAARGRRRGRP